MLPVQNTELLPQRQVFQNQIAARAQTSSKETNQELQQANHSISFTWEHTKFGIRFIYLI
jgi:hypothetical protein